MEQEFKNISEKAKKLLKREEGYEVDFKRNIKVDSEDLVAFANSKKVGSILLGVEENTDPEGRQKAKIVGCRVGDESRQQILSKAQNCIPPIDINILIENSDEKPFYRIEIPSGNIKPYCTQKGIYKIRDDGNNKLITPDKLLSMFIEIESEQFIERFKKAAEELESNLNDVSRDINEFLTHLEEIIPRLDVLEEYSYMSDEILGTIGKMEDRIGDIDSTVILNERRLLTLLKHFNIEDPHVRDIKNNIKSFITYDLKKKKDHNKQNYLGELKGYYSKYSGDFLESCYEDAIKELDK